MSRPQPRSDVAYGGHFSPLLARLLRRRLPMLPPEARVVAWHRQYGDGPRALLAVVRLPDGRTAWAQQPLPPRVGVRHRHAVGYLIDRMARTFREMMAPVGVC